MLNEKYNVGGRELLRITHERIAEIELTEGIAETIDSIVLDDNIADFKGGAAGDGDFKGGAVSIRMSYGLRKENYSPYDTINTSLGRIADLRKLLKEGDPVYIKIRINAAGLTSDDVPYIIKRIEINDTTVPDAHIDIKYIDDYLYVTSLPYDRNIFQPYQTGNMAPAIELNRSLADTVNRMYGHDVVYFKVTEDENRVNHTFKVYEKYYVESVKYIRVLVPENDFKDRQIVYTDWNTVYEEDVEIHITIDNFERVFGADFRPEAHDIVFVPQIATIFDVQYAHAERKFMNEIFWYKALLRKYTVNEKIDTTTGDQNHTNFDIANFVDQNISPLTDVATNPESTDTSAPTAGEVPHPNFQHKKQQSVEGLASAKLHMYTDRSMHESLRLFAHRRVHIISELLQNAYVTFSTQCYELGDVPIGEAAIEYAGRLAGEADMTFACWASFANLRSSFDMVRIGNMAVSFDRGTVKAVQEGITLLGTEEKLEAGVWYFITLRLNSELHTVEIVILRRSDEVNALTDQKLTQTAGESGETKGTKLIGDGTDLAVSVLGGRYRLAMFRLYRSVLTDKDLLGMATSKSSTVPDSIIIDNVASL